MMLNKFTQHFDHSFVPSSLTNNGGVRGTAELVASNAVPRWLAPFQFETNFDVHNRDERHRDDEEQES